MSRAKVNLNPIAQPVRSSRPLRNDSQAELSPLTCSEVEAFQARAEANIPLAAAEEIRPEAAHTQEAVAAHTREAVEGNIPLAHICAHMDQDDSLAGTRAVRVHLGRRSHKGHDESRGRSLPPQE
jgi:hypothetical protein